MEKEDSSATHTTRIEQMKKVQQEGLELFIQKNKDYGDAFAKYGVVGVLMRMEDKLQRGISITKNGVHLVSQEGMRDTLIDLHNYSAMAVMLMDEKTNEKKRRVAFCEKEYSINPNFYPPMPPSGLLDVFGEEDFQLNAFKPVVDIDKKRD